MSLLPAFLLSLVKLVQTVLQFAHESLYPEFTAPFAESEKYSQIRLKRNIVFT